MNEARSEPFVVSKLSRESAETLESTLRKADVDDKIDAFHVAKLSHPSAESLRAGALESFASVEQSDPPDLPRLLRVDGERRDEEATSNSAKECPPGNH